MRGFQIHAFVAAPFAVMIPYSTDAPLYHLPIGTAVLITVNVVCFLVHGPLTPGHPWVLEFGVPPHPQEWLTSMFAHDGILHLVGNMYFLAAFGLIVEGKLGFRRFILLYLSIGLLASASTQLIMWPRPGAGAVGASSAIMGLMAVCLVWAPKNEFSVFMILPMPFFFVRVLLFDVSILVYASFYTAYEFFWLMLYQFQMSTPALHLIGISVGFGAGVLYVKRDWVDCENWDLFAVWSGTYGRFGDASTTVGSHADASLLFGKDVNVTELIVPEDDRPKARQRGADSPTNVQQLIDSGRFMEASEVLFSAQLGNTDLQLSESRLKRLARGLQDANAIEEAEFFLQEYVDRFETNADWACLRLAHLLVKHRQRPRAAIRLLKRVRLSRLPPDQQQRAKSLVAQAKKMIRAGVEDSADEFGWDEE